MAATVPEVGGYDLPFDKEPPDSLKCLICFTVAREPRQHEVCGRLFCKGCLEEHSRQNHKCPNCREGHAQYFQDIKSSREVEALVVKCPNYKTDCNWKGELCQLESHSITCPERIVTCPRKCTTINGSKFECLLRDLDEHMEESCPYRMLECPHCNEMGTHKGITEAHLDHCPMMLASCPSEGCDTKLSSSLVLFHLLTECEFALIECQHWDIGCQAVLPRRTISEHENDSALHSQMLVASVKDLQRQLRFLTNENTKLRELVGEVHGKPHGAADISGAASSNQVTLKVPFRNEEKFTYDHIYTSTKKGYRLNVQILLNNDGYISVYFFMMRGDHDEHLSWPFKGNITIELLNQLEDDDHYTKQVEFPKEHGQRVRHGEMQKEGYGMPKFIDTRLLEKPRKKGKKETKKLNARYLLNKVMYFRFLAVGATASRSWLHCSS